MTYTGKFGSLIEDLIKSSREISNQSTDDAKSAEREGAARQDGGESFDPRYAALLARILTEQPLTEPPCVQFLSCHAGESAGKIAFGTARSAASVLGRTLLLNTRLDYATDSRANTCGDVLDQITRSALPDAFTQHLYHRRLFRNAADLALLYGRSRKDALCTIAAPFRLVVIDAGAVSDGPAAESLAPFCVGTVLVVVAGIASQASVNEASRHVCAAGGRVIGTVLTDTPPDLPLWIRTR